MLILFHDEYATQEMYDNYRRFVSNGGTILFIDANVFIAEVDYDKENQTISLTKGHDWEFVNSTFARKSVIERWFNENKEWMGSNFLVSEITGNVTFANNPFNYTHFEENYVNNHDAKILIDYDIVLPKKSPYTGLSVASYQLKYGNGNVVMIGLYGQQLIQNQEFIKFVDSLIDNSLA
jgi:N,N-dimethylformamidase beta subunit-like protein